MSRRCTLLAALALLSALLLSVLLLSVLASPFAPALAQGGLPQITVPGELDADAIERYADKLDAYAPHGDQCAALPEEFRPEERAEGHRALDL